MNPTHKHCVTRQRERELVDDMAGHGEAGPLDSKPSSSIACLACRKVKMKCRPASDGDGSGGKCHRCMRKSLDCVFQEHCRGRKLGTRISKRRSSLLHAASLTPTTPAHAVSSEGVAALSTPPTPSQRPGLGRNADWETGDLQPSGLLNHAVTQGKFSLRNVLNATNPNALDVSIEPSSIPSDDPIQLGLVNISIAESLYHNFVEVLNPYISQLDPSLHTFNYVRQRSSFLFSTILAAAAKAFNPALFRALYDHAETLLANSFRKGKKSTEVAQAIMIHTYWKEPDDNRAWVSLGYVIRVGMDLGWHRLALSTAGDPDLTDETLKREARNVQRTWYVLFVYDRSMSLQTGKPWMIERDGFIESVELWCRDPLATPNDRLLGAFVTLRLLSSEVFKLLGPKPSRVRPGPLHSMESLLAIIKSRIEEWEQRWTSMVNADSCHPFLIRFYGTHLRLQLFSLPLQDALSSGDQAATSSLEMLWVSYSSAIEMLELICQSSSWLYFAQDSIHVMTAYCSTFLIKLLLSTSKSVHNQIEAKVISAIGDAALVFSQLAAPPGSTCALQARFLDKVISNYMEKKAGLTGVDPNQADPHNLDNEKSGSLQTSAESSRMGEIPRMPLSGESAHHDGSLMNVLYNTKLDLVYGEDDHWEGMFAGAGFSVQDGIFYNEG
ncbi:hypothetical protein BX600DRAFT_487129 [Xylariales sp. PMI_506]|nr:hypothetical protein BX600DRAFT_487129 [Xylariales sp. PMI_506]